MLVALLALALTASTTEMLAATATPPCFDWVVVGHLTSQTYVGPLPVGPGELTLDSVFSSEAVIDTVLLGKNAPKRTELFLVAHTEIPPQGASNLMMILGQDANGQINLLQRQHLRGFKGILVTRAAARRFAAESGLAQCGPPP